MTRGTVGLTMTVFTFIAVEVYVLLMLKTNGLFLRFWPDKMKDIWHNDLLVLVC